MGPCMKKTGCLLMATHSGPCQVARVAAPGPRHTNPFCPAAPGNDIAGGEYADAFPPKCICKPVEPSPAPAGDQDGFKDCLGAYKEWYEKERAPYYPANSEVGLQDRGASYAAWEHLWNILAAPNHRIKTVPAPASPAPAGDPMAEIMLRGATAMLDAIEREIPRNDADRDYADTVIQEFRSLRAKLNLAEAYIEDLKHAASPPPVQAPAARAKRDEYALKGAGWKTEHPKGELGSHPAVWISPDGRRMPFAEARKEIQAPAAGPLDLGLTPREDLHDALRKAIPNLAQRNAAIDRILAGAPSAGRPAGFDTWWKSHTEWDGAFRYPKSEEKKYRECALAAWQAAQSPITPEGAGRPMKLDAEADSAALKVWGPDLRAWGPKLAAVKQRLIFHYDMVEEEYAKEIAYRINAFEGAGRPMTWTALEALNGVSLIDIMLEAARAKGFFNRVSAFMLDTFAKAIRSHLA